MNMQDYARVLGRVHMRPACRERLLAAAAAGEKPRRTGISRVLDGMLPWVTGAAACVMLLVFGGILLSGLHGIGEQPKPAASVAESSAEVPEAPQESNAELHFGSSVRWNAEKQEYYDSDYYRWDAESHRYFYLSDAERIAKQKAEGRYIEPEIYEEAEEFAGEIPEEWLEAVQRYANADAAGRNADPLSGMKSFINVREYAPEEYRALTVCSVRHFETCAELSVTTNDYSWLAMHLVNDILQAKLYSSNTPGEYAVKIKKLYADADAAVCSAGDALTAENVAALQEDYGFMIAPALRRLGRLDLMQIPADAPCTDAEKLADFAEFFNSLF